jgi:membrane glycosyltransferase
LSGGVAAVLAWGLATDLHMAWWLMPVALPLLLAAPLVVLTSRAGLGERLRAQALLLTPEELATPTVLCRAWVHMRQGLPAPRWHDVVTDPWLFKVVCLAMGPRSTAGGARGRTRSRLIQRLSEQQDAEAISPAERMRLMSEPQSIARLRARLAANESFGVFGGEPGHVPCPRFAHEGPASRR